MTLESNLSMHTPGPHPLSADQIAGHSWASAALSYSQCKASLPSNLGNPGGDFTLTNIRTPKRERCNKSP